MWYRCIDCGHAFKARNRYVPTRQCGQCFSRRIEKADRPDFKDVDGSVAKELFLMFKANKSPIECVIEYELNPTLVRNVYREYLTLRKLEMETSSSNSKLFSFYPLKEPSHLQKDTSQNSFNVSLAKKD